MTDQTEALQEKFGGYWAEHPEYPVEDWQFEVANGDTRLGYWAWLEGKLDEAQSDIDLVGAITEKTSTSRQDWQEMDGPETGRGVEYWFHHDSSNQFAYICVENGEIVTLEITDGQDEDSRPDSEPSGETSTGLPTEPFTVTWSIDLDAHSHEDAARQALVIQRDPESIATVFEVAQHKGGPVRDARRIDLGGDRATNGSNDEDAGG